MAAVTTKQAIPPEKVDVASGKRTGHGPVDFQLLCCPFYNPVTRKPFSASVSLITFPITTPITATY
jgi:endo-1,4-beta-D-glucanase Y